MLQNVSFDIVLQPDEKKSLQKQFQTAAGEIPNSSHPESVSIISEKNLETSKVEHCL